MKTRLIYYFDAWGTRHDISADFPQVGSLVLAKYNVHNIKTGETFRCAAFFTSLLAIRSAITIWQEIYDAFDYGYSFSIE